jgi:hypothetical protein
MLMDGRWLFQTSNDYVMISTCLNNPFTRRKVRQVVEGEGYECPEICSPEELLEVDK